jgi:hypothetical protein
MLRASLEAVRNSASTLRGLVRTADRERASGAASGRQAVPLKLDIGPGFSLLRFKGIRHRTEPSGISGGTAIVYTGEPHELDIPFYNQIVVVDSVTAPAGYIVPPEWTFVPDNLALHGIQFRRTAAAESLTVEMTRFADVRMGAKPYEGRQTATYAAFRFTARQYFPAGSIVVPTEQRAAHVAVHLLEPRSGDSFMAWGFFNAVLEQKEYAEDYVMESVGKKLLRDQPDLRAEYLAKVAADTVFNRSPGSRLNWLYLHSPWGDRTFNVYPVGRMDQNVLRTLRTERSARR